MQSAPVFFQHTAHRQTAEHGLVCPHCHCGLPLALLVPLLHEPDFARHGLVVLGSDALVPLLELLLLQDALDCPLVCISCLLLLHSAPVSQCGTSWSHVME